MKMSEQNKRHNFAILIQIWIRASAYSGKNKTQAIGTLTEFLTTEFNWKKRKAGEAVLDYFKSIGTGPDELLDIWQVLQE